jgi:hypothetical protein
MIKAACVLIFFGFASVQQSQKINWKKIRTKVQAEQAMELLVPAETTFTSAAEILAAQKSDFYGLSADTLIYFHSPLVPVRPLSWVARKWMYQLHFADQNLVSVQVEEG